MRAVDFGPGEGNAVHRRLDDDVLFRVEAPADFMPLAGRHAELFAQATDIEAMRYLGRCAVIAGGEDAFVLDGYGPDPAAQAGRALRHEGGDVHEVVGPSDAGHSGILL